MQNEYTRFKLLCAIVNNEAKPVKFEFYKNSELMSDIASNGFQIENIQDESSLTKPKVTIDDNANYSCIASNRFGQDSIHVVLTVKSKIHFNS